MNLNRMKFALIFAVSKFSFLILGVISLISVTSSNCAVQCKKCHITKPIRVISTTVKWGDPIRAIGSGTYVTTGNCTPTLLAGWLKLNEENQWDTIQRIQDLGILMCGFDEGIWCEDTLELSTLEMSRRLGLTTEKPIGTYKFTYYFGNSKSRDMQVSDPFEIHL